MNPSVDIASLPGPAQKILDPAGPAPLKMMAAKGVAPGLKPGDVVLLVLLLAEGEGPAAEQAKKTLEALPAPLLNGALAGDLHPGVLDALGTTYASNAGVAERILLHPAILPDTVVAMAKVASEPVCELIATNEERMLAHPAIIEALYLNRSTRMSTADRILELAVRNKIELALPAFAQAAAAIAGELIEEPSEEPSFVDGQFADAQRIAAEVQLDDGEDTHALNEDTGVEEVVDKAKPLHAVWAMLRASERIRLVQLGGIHVRDEKTKKETEYRFDQKALRMIGIRDANPLVSTSALKAPGMTDADVVRIATLRNISQDVLGEIAISREWTRHYMVKYNLVANPRTPFAHAVKFIVHLRENDLKMIAKSKDVSGAVQTAARQQLQRKGK